ncbi:MAG: hypothetical protein CMM87_01665 [Rickettsiales bacterium]|nr:hypothetical protein [Rickettsiales bacterium]|tara:strand:- start:2708 stop:3451 length:744 start_codon:yes stop_codon:yes gene_type:complete
MKKCFILLLSLFISQFLHPKVDVYFQSPISTGDATIKKSCHTSVSEQLNQLIRLKKEHPEKRCKLRIAMYELSNLSTINTLIAAAELGIQVDILTDTKQFNAVLEKNDRKEQQDINKSLQKLSRYEIVMIFPIGNPYKKGDHYNNIRTFHDKFSVMYCDGRFDQGVAMLGSFNWTGAASRINYEDCAIITEDSAIIKRMDQRFEKIKKIETDKYSKKPWRHKPKPVAQKRKTISPRRSPAKRVESKS